MPINIRERDPNETFGASIGSNLNKGVESGLRHLLDTKVADVKHRQMVSELRGLGIDPQSATFIARLPQKNQLEALDMYRTQGQQLQSGQQGGMGSGRQDANNMQGMGQNQQQQMSPLLGGKARKEELLAAHAEQKANAGAQKEARGWYSELLTKGKNRKEGMDRLNKMEKLVDKGGLPIATFYNLYKNLEESSGHLSSIINPVGTLLRSIQRQTSPNTEMFEKLSNQFIKGAKDIFGSRITDNDLKAYMAQIPTLGNTDEGKRAIIKDMQSAYEAEDLMQWYAKRIIKENGGKIPNDLQAQVEERTGPELDRLAAKFMNAGQ